MGEAGAGVARYLYAVTRGLGDGALAGRSGVRGAPLAIVHHDGLDAVVSDVPLPEFGEEGLRENLEKLPWLEEVARAHDQVVRDVGATGAPTAPLRLATIFHDDRAVRRRVEEWREPIVAALDRVEGRGEWSVKLVVPPAPAPVDQPAPTTGTEFLMRRKEQAGRRARDDRDAAGLADRVHGALARLAEAVRLLPPQDPQLTGHTGRMVLNGAYLLPVGAETAVRALVDDLRARHPDTDLELSGPWPPYSFATLEPR